MKALFIAFLCFFSVLGGTRLFLSGSPPVSTLLLSTLQPQELTGLTLIYSDIALERIRAFPLNGEKLTSTSTSYTSYGEGFLPSALHDGYLKKVNSYRKAHRLSAFTNFYNYYEDSERVILCFTGGLENIYVFQKKSQKLVPLCYAPQENLGPMYVSHIQPLENSYVLLGGEVNAYASIVYEVAKEHLNILSGYHFETSTRAINHQNYGLTKEGDALYVEEKGLLYFDSKTKSLSHIPLAFSPQFVFNDASTTIALCLNRDLLTYSLLERGASISKPKSLPLPNSHVELIRGVLKGQNLYILYYDSHHPLYKNYLCIYNLSTQKLTYCLALEAYKNLALLDMSLS